MIYNPFLDQLYTASKGRGAFLSSPHSALPALAVPRRLPLARPRALPSLGQALVGIEWGSDRSKEMVEKKGDSFKRLAGNPAEGVAGGRMAHSLRSYGSAALNYAMVAQGGLDLYWEIGCWCVCARGASEGWRSLIDVNALNCCRPWDICAGAIIAQEAGGFVAGSHGAPLDNDVNEDVLWGRKHIVVRAIGDTEVRSVFSVSTAPTRVRPTGGAWACSLYACTRTLPHAQ